jgi:hypothetical protein
MSTSDDNGAVKTEGRLSALQRAQDKAAAAADRAKSSVVRKMMDRFNAVDFMNAIITRLGHNPQAAEDVDGLISSGHRAVPSLTVSGCIFLLLPAIAIASTLQGWYERSSTNPRLRTGRSSISTASRGRLDSDSMSGCCCWWAAR